MLYTCICCPRVEIEVSLIVYANCRYLDLLLLISQLPQNVCTSIGTRFNGQTIVVPLSLIHLTMFM